MTDTQKTARKTAWDVIGIELAVDLRPDAHKELLDRIARAIMEARDKALEDAQEAVRSYWCLDGVASLVRINDAIRALKEPKQ